MTTVAKRILAAKKVDPVRVHIRWMIRRDMGDVLQIERDSFTLPWEEEDFLRCLRRRNCIGMVAEIGEKVVGHMMYELHDSELTIINFAVAATHRGRTVGTQMLGKLKSKLSSHRHTRLVVDVSEDNLPAHLFLRRNRLLATEVLPGHYGDHDAYRFVFEVEAEASDF